MLHTNARAILVGLEWDVKYQTALVHLIVTTAGIATLLSNLPNVKTAAKAGWDPHAKIHVNLESRFQWTVANATAGLVIQVSEEFPRILHVPLVSFYFTNELFLALQVCVNFLLLVSYLLFIRLQSDCKVTLLDTTTTTTTIFISSRGHLHFKWSSSEP